jgi:hypothetical protein
MQFRYLAFAAPKQFKRGRLATAHVFALRKMFVLDSRPIDPSLQTPGICVPWGFVFFMYHF